MFCQYVLLFVAAASTVARVTCDQPPEPFVIVHEKSNYVLDGRGREVKLRRFSGSDSQYWTTEDDENGMVYIINKETGKVLDSTGVQPSKKAKVVTAAKNYGEKQKWFINFSGTIENAASDKLVVDIPRIEPGGKLILYHKTGGSNQKFRFHKYDH